MNSKDTAHSFSLAELCIVAASRAWADDGEVLATGIGLIPRLGASLAMLSCNPELLMTDGEAYLLDTPVPVGKRDASDINIAGWMPYSKVFDVIYGGKRHAMVTPVQIDRWGQTNISHIGTQHEQPKSQLLGCRGFPGNTISHPNSMFIPNHGQRTFVSGEVDMISGVGYNPERWPEGRIPVSVCLRYCITDLCVMDFGGKDNGLRVLSLHPGVSFEEVQENTGFELEILTSVAQTPPPTEQQLTIINSLDPHNLRATVFKDNPPGDKAAR